MTSRPADPSDGDPTRGADTATRRVEHDDPERTIASADGTGTGTDARFGTGAPGIARPAARNGATRPLAPQLDLFAEADELRRYVGALELDDLSPREALDHLYRLAELAAGTR